MFSEGLFNFLTFILSSSNQPKKFLVFAAAILLVNVLVAVSDWKWGRGIGFTILALLTGAFSVYVSMVFLQAMRQYLEMELAYPESFASLDAYIAMLYHSAAEGSGPLGLGMNAASPQASIRCAILLASTLPTE